ncbi:hypothetical protein GCM10022240_00090 [Microbacterium kribbense]|uniref:Uncharacterized protein n=1 Tax=Microbacterium kribbense TaxID=433645 RepID=A0ABP7FZB0_9MICO
MRAVTAAPGDQPASISPRAQGPDIPNEKAAPSATSTPAPIPEPWRAEGARMSLATVLMVNDITRG